MLAERRTSRKIKVGWVEVGGGEPLFGKWQRLLLLELDEPKARDVLFHVFGE